MDDRPQTVGAALTEAQTIIAAAEERAAKIVAAAKSEIDKARKAAFEEGLAAGRAASADAAIRMIDDLSAVRQRASKEAAKLAIAICRSVFTEQAEIDPALVQFSAERALAQSIVGGELQIIVHSEDLKSIEVIKDKLKLLTGGAIISLSSDAGMERGGCLIRTEFGEIDSTLSALLDGIARKLGIDDGR